MRKIQLNQNFKEEHENQNCQAVNTVNKEKTDWDLGESVVKSLKLRD